MAKPDRLIKIILGAEGGYVNHPNDRGKQTNHGVTIGTFRFIFGKDKTVQDLINMTEEQWLIVFNYYWNNWQASKIKYNCIADLLVDWHWGSGLRGITKAQQALQVYPDGVVGDITLAAINDSKDPKALFNTLKDARMRHYMGITEMNPSQAVFRAGWRNRVNMFKWYDNPIEIKPLSKEEEEKFKELEPVRGMAVDTASVDTVKDSLNPKYLEVLKKLSVDTIPVSLRASLIHENFLKKFETCIKE